MNKTNKTKLTPCRQMGLSRKRKSLNPSPQNVSSTNNNINKTLESPPEPNSNTTPIKKDLSTQIKRKKLSIPNVVASKTSKPSEELELPTKNTSENELNRELLYEQWNKCTENEIEAEIKNLERTLENNISVLEEEKRKCVYRKKHDLNKLKKLIAMWTRGCQDALESLLDAINLKKNDGPLAMEKLLEELNLDCDLVKYNQENESFDT